MKKGLLRKQGGHTQNELYHIPAELCDEIAAVASKINADDKARSQSTSLEREP